MSIFSVALELGSPAERDQYLQQACGDNLELRERIEALLRSSAKAASFMEVPPAAVETRAIIDPPVTEQAGMQIGPYKLLQQIGEGGMGVVYMAEQKEPVKRRVALKIVKPGMDTRQVIARFEAERQALAMMDHPNIARVLDAGATDTGRPYFVMELVNGIPITKYCDQQHLTPKDRLELFLPVCQAVQHAHQKGIIHRDLKPSNILAALYDGQPVPKVIDFGVAKATGQTLTEKTMFTQYGQVVGTVEYMSPEQAERNQLDIDTRSDIYSLGVLLYELLTGDTPFDRQRLRSAAWEEMLRIIREEEPPRPSVKLTSSAALPSIAANRHIESHKLSTLVRGELDWIVMKALEKDRGRRYETAGKFAEDVQNYLHDRPVAACPPAASYKFKKLVQRNKVLIATASLIAASLLVGIVGTTWQAVRATDEQRRANRLLTSERNTRRQLIDAETREARQGAHAAAAIAAALAESERLQNADRWDEAMAAVRRVETLTVAGLPDPSLAGRVRQRVIDLQTVAQLERIRGDSLSVGEEGLVTYEQTDRDYATAFRAHGVDVDSLEADVAADRIRAGSVSLALASALDHWADVRLFRQDNEGRRHLLRIAQMVDHDDWRNRLRDMLQQSETDSQEIERFAQSASVDDLAPVTFIQLAAALFNTGSKERAIDVLQQGQRRHPSDFWINYYLGNYCVNIDPQRWDDSLRFYTAAVALRPLNPRARRGLGHVVDEKAHQSGYHRATERERDIALLELQEAIRLNAADPWTHQRLAGTLLQKGRWDEAVFHFHRAIELDPDANAFVRLPVRLGGSYFSPRHWENAVVAFGRFTRSHPQSAWGLLHFGWALQQQGRWEQSLPVLQQSVKLEPKWFFAHFHLARAYHKMGDLDRAIAQYEEALRCDLGDSSRNFPEPGGFHGARLRYFLGRALQAQGKYDQAIVKFEQAIPLERDSGFDAAFPHQHFALASALADAQQWDRAIEAGWNAIDRCDDDFDPGPWMEVVQNDEFFTRLARHRPNDLRPQLMRARAFALQRNWQRAIDQYTRLLPARPGGQNQNVEYACLLLLRNDREAFQRQRTRLLKNIPNDNEPGRCFLRARIAAIAPENNLPPEELVAWAKQSIADEPHLERLQILALAHYRAGQFGLAIQRAEQSCTKPWPGLSGNLPILAMAHHRLGQIEQAQRILQEAHAERGLNRREFGLGTGRAREFLIFEVLLREAETLLGVPAAESKENGPGVDADQTPEAGRRLQTEEKETAK